MHAPPAAPHALAAVADAAPPLLAVRAARRHFGAFAALDGVTLDVAEGEVVAVIGPSGSGKSTLVRCIHQLERLDSGAIYLGGELLGHRRQAAGAKLQRLPERDIARQRQRIGMVFQQFGLFPHLSVLHNVAEGPVQVLGDAPERARADALRLLTRVGLADKAAQYPSQLSGGQQQRVAIARALAMRPRLLLLDEPTSALDPELVGEVLDVLADLARGGMTMLVVTHEIAFAREAAHRVVFMDAGRIVEQGPARATLAAPRSQRLQVFLSRVV